MARCALGQGCRSTQAVKADLDAGPRILSSHLATLVLLTNSGVQLQHGLLDPIGSTHEHDPGRASQNITTIFSAFHHPCSGGAEAMLPLLPPWYPMPIRVSGTGHIHEAHSRTS